jgi:hypothetical protein
MYIDLVDNFWYSMTEAFKKLDVRFFCTSTRNEPVRGWLSALPKEDKKIIGNDILKV